jgi:hypothetical protein
VTTLVSRNYLQALSRQLKMCWNAIKQTPAFQENVQKLYLRFKIRLLWCNCGWILTQSQKINEQPSQSTEERATLDRYHHFHGHSGMCAWLSSWFALLCFLSLPSSLLIPPGLCQKSNHRFILNLPKFSSPVAAAWCYLEFKLRIISVNLLHSSG